MQIWIKSNAGRVRLPVLPPSYNVTSGQDNTTMTVCGLGEIAVKGKRKLRGVSFSSIFPRHDETYVEGSHKNPLKYVEKIEKMKRAGAVKLIITGTPINMQVTIDEFDWGEADGTGDIAYTLTLKEDIHPTIVASTLMRADGSAAATAGAGGNVTGTADSARSAPDQTSTTTYTVVSGDTLSMIARKLTGSASWTAIYEQNKSLIGSNPNSISVGMVLTISGAKR